MIMFANLWAINCLLENFSVYQYGASCQNDCNLYNVCQIIHLFYPTKKNTAYLISLKKTTKEGRGRDRSRKNVDLIKNQ